LKQGNPEFVFNEDFGDLITLQIKNILIIKQKKCKIFIPKTLPNKKDS